MKYTMTYIIGAAKSAANTFGRNRIPKALHKRKLFLMGIVNFLTVANIWAQVNAPTSLRTTAVSYNYVALAWTDSNTVSKENHIVVSRSLQTSPTIFSNLATLTAGAASYTDSTVAPITTYNYKVTIYPKNSSSPAVSGPISVTTLAPPDTTPPSVPTGLTATAASSSQINLSWSASTDTGGSGLAGYKIYSGGTLPFATTTATTYSVTGRAPGVQCCYTVVAYDNAGNLSAKSAQACATTSSSGSAPSATTTSASNISSNTATSNGGCTPNGLATTANFQWGTTTAYGNSTASQSMGSGTTSLSVAAGLGTLAPSTTYHYRLMANNSMGTTYGADMSFTTSASAGAAPTATTTAATFVSSGAATLKGSANPNGLTTTAYFQWGTTTSYGNTTVSQSAGSGTTAVALAQALSGLSTSTTYHYRLVATNSKGTSYGADVAFTTASSGGVPTVTTTAASNVSSNSATLNGSANANLFATTTYFQWGTTTSYGSTTASQSIGSGSLAVNVSANLSGLSPSTTYHYRLVASNSLGTINGADATFTTAAAVGGGSGSWAMSFGGTGVDAGYSVATDASGNIFVAGSFNGTVNFGGGPRTCLGADINAGDIFVAKYSPTGAYIWDKTFGSTNSNAGDAALGIAVDKTTGDVAVTGYYGSSSASQRSVISFGTNTFTSTASRDAFVLKLSGANGAVQWAKSLGTVNWSNNPDDFGFAVAIDPINGDVVAAGQVSCNGTFNFGGGLVFAGASGNNSFIIRYTSTGAFLWARTPSSIGPDFAKAVAVDNSGNVLVAGDGANINVGYPLSGPILSNYVYVAKFTSAGTFTWGVGAGAGLLASHMKALAVDSSGNVAVCGTSYGDITFGSVQTTNLPTSVYSAFLAKLSGTTGAGLWAKGFTTPNGGNINLSGVAFDVLGKVIVTGNFGLSCNFVDATLVAAGSQVGLLAEFNGSGAYISSMQFGGPGTANPNGVVADGTGNILVTGYTTGGDFDGVTLPAVGSCDVFLMKLAP
jgi:hypothetical protein